MARRELTGILLVGGASRRFGSPKALARFGEETLAARAWRLLGESCAERIAVGKQGELELPFPLLDDGSAVRASLAGLVAGLRAARSEVAVVVPVDVPLLRPADLHALADACFDAAVPSTGPLPGAYRRSALPVLERRLAARELRLRDALAELDVAEVELDPQRLANVNTPADLAGLGGPRIVALGPGHAAAFREFVAASLREFGFDPDPALDPDLRDPLGAYVAAWIALDGDGNVVGSVVLIRRDEGDLLLRRMYLAPAYRGRGIGRRLLELALAWARGGEYDRVRLDTTDAMVAARGLYESVGFREIGEGKPRAGRRRIEYTLDLRDEPQPRP